MNKNTTIVCSLLVVGVIIIATLVILENQNQHHLEAKNLHSSDMAKLQERMTKQEEETAAQNREVAELRYQMSLIANHINAQNTVVPTVMPIPPVVEGFAAHTKQTV